MPKKEKDNQEITLKDLESKAYRLLVMREQINRELQQVEQEIQKLK